jgi:hypothetical protein
MKPLAIDLFCGLGGWTEGLLAEGYHARGYDIEAHEYGDEKYPGELILADVMTLHGSQFADAALIVASPPCQEFSYMAMPWSRAKQIARALRGQDVFPDGYTGSRTLAELTALFDASFRLQREASEAAGRHVPMVVENVRGAVPWIGPAAWNYGSYYLWGDVPALMPQRLDALKVASKTGRRTDPGNGVRFTSRDCGVEGIKQPGISGKRNNGKGDAWFQDGAASSGSKSLARKAASAKIAKIPLTLSSWIARTYKPEAQAA